MRFVPIDQSLGQDVRRHVEAKPQVSLAIVWDLDRWKFAGLASWWPMVVREANGGLATPDGLATGLFDHGQFGHGSAVAPSGRSAVIDPTAGSAVVSEPAVRP